MANPYEPNQGDSGGAGSDYNASDALNDTGVSHLTDGAVPAYNDGTGRLANSPLSYDSSSQDFTFSNAGGVRVPALVVPSGNITYKGNVQLDISSVSSPLQSQDGNVSLLSGDHLGVDVDSGVLSVIPQTIDVMDLQNVGALATGNGIIQGSFDATVTLSLFQNHIPGDWWQAQFDDSVNPALSVGGYTLGNGDRLYVVQDTNGVTLTNDNFSDYVAYLENQDNIAQEGILGNVRLSTATPATETESGNAGTQNGNVASADHSHPFATQPVAHGGTGLTTIPLGSILYTSANNNIAALTNSSTANTILVNNSGVMGWSASPTLTDVTVSGLARFDGRVEIPRDPDHADNHGLYIVQSGNVISSIADDLNLDFATDDFITFSQQENGPISGWSPSTTAVMDVRTGSLALGANKTPEAMLDVTGDVLATGGATFGDSVTVSNDSQVELSNTGNTRRTFIRSSGVYAAVDSVPYNDGTSDTTRNSQWCVRSDYADTGMRFFTIGNNLVGGSFIDFEIGARSDSYDAERITLQKPAYSRDLTSTTNIYISRQNDMNGKVVWGSRDNLISAIGEHNLNLSLITDDFIDFMSTENGPQSTRNPVRTARMNVITGALALGADKSPEQVLDVTGNALVTGTITAGGINAPFVGRTTQPQAGQIGEVLHAQSNMGSINSNTGYFAYIDIPAGVWEVNSYFSVFHTTAVNATLTTGITDSDSVIPTNQQPILQMEATSNFYMSGIPQYITLSATTRYYLLYNVSTTDGRQVTFQPHVVDMIARRIS